MSVPRQDASALHAPPHSFALPVGMRVTPKAKNSARSPRKVGEARRLPATERQGLVQTLHDTVCQSLTAAYLLAKFTEKNAQNGQPATADELSGLCEMIHGVVGELQEFACKLRGEGEAAARGRETIH